MGRCSYLNRRLQFCLFPTSRQRRDLDAIAPPDCCPKGIVSDTNEFTSASGLPFSIQMINDRIMSSLRKCAAKDSLPSAKSVGRIEIVEN